MKLSIAALAVGAGAAMAQSLSDLPPCGQTCVNNMINIASSEFGCKLGDVNCYCTNANFGYGIRDCSNESCSKDDAAKVIAFGTAYCQNQVSGGVSASGSATPTGGSAASILSSAAATATGSGGASGSGASAASTAITTVPLVATAVSDGKTVLQTTGFSTVYSSLSGAAGSVTGSAASALSSATESANSAISSALSSASSVAASASSKAASAASSAAGAASSAASKATGSGSASSTGAAPKMTGLPLAGAAGMAALFFL